MKIRNFLSIVPQVVKRWALIIAGCVVVIGLVVGYHAASEAANLGAGVRTMSIFAGASLFGGVVIATWLVCLGFVYADARQRCSLTCWDFFFTSFCASQSPRPALTVDRLSRSTSNSAHGAGLHRPTEPRATRPWQWARARAVSQLLWPHKDRGEWFSLGENHGR